MQALSAAHVLDLWERGYGLHPVDKALLILSHACPGYSFDQLTRLSLGRRDALLIRLRALTFGDVLAACTECPRCGESLEFSCSTRSLLVESATDLAAEKSLAIDGHELRLRCPDSRDAAAAAACPDLSAAKDLLVTRCVRRAAPEDEPAGDESLPEAIQPAIAKALAEIDPQAEILFDLNCSACGHLWQYTFDIVSYFWAEIQARARRLLQEVDLLARRYGWTERDIIALSDTRRSLYLQMALT